MAIELSNLTFTNRADRVPLFGITEITNSGITNALGGSDEITGIGESLQNILFYGLRTVGIYNHSNGALNTDNGDDEITGYGNIGIYNEFNATINTGNGRDEITGYASQTGSSKNNTIGFLNDGIVNTGSGDDRISGFATGDYPGGVVNSGYFDTGNGNDTIRGDGLTGGVNNLRKGAINTGHGNDRIIGTSNKDWGVYNGGYDESGSSTINTGDGDDRIIGTTTDNYGAGIASVLKGALNTDNGDDRIIGTGSIAGIVCTEDGTINTSKGNDIITGIGSVNGITIGSFSGSTSSKATIRTGEGNDVITGIGGIFNDTLGTIDTGSGNDSVDARNGGFSGLGVTLLGNGEDIVKGFGSGDFYGGRGEDLLELAAGTYTVGILDTKISFTNNGITMNTFEFEKLIAGSTLYNFTSLFNGQTITVT